MAEWQTLGQVAGATQRYVVIDSERDLGFTIAGTLQVKVPKGGGQPGAEFEVRFVAEHEYPNDPLWNGQGEPPSKIRADHERELRERLEEATEDQRKEAEKNAADTPGVTT